ncbi:MAG: hypothetical protein R3E87_12115 [Burkholderiaceae bacterium]
MTRSNNLLRSLRQLLPLAALFALVFSSQYLFQPFVWRHWPVDIVLMGWIEILRDRLLVAACVVAAVAWLASGPVRRPRLQKPATAAAIALGASSGEALLVALGVPSASSTWLEAVERVVRWSVFTGGLALIWLTWSRALTAEAAARDISQAQAAAERQRNALRLQAL